MMKPDPYNIHSLKAFFEDYKGLTSNQLAIIAEVSSCTITDWKRKCGVIKSDYKKPPIKAKGPIPENWDNKEWFEQAYEKMGLRALALLIGKGGDWRFAANRLKRYGIRRKTYAERVGSDNPCCDEGWLHYYYSDRDSYLKWCKKNKIESCEDGGQKLNLHGCGELASVSHQTIANWLSLFKIKPRDLSESQLGKKTKITPKMRRAYRDRFFRLYRSGTINITLGEERFSNGSRVGKEETVSKRFNRNLRGTPPRSTSRKEVSPPSD